MELSDRPDYSFEGETERINESGAAAWILADIQKVLNYLAKG